MSYRGKEKLDTGLPVYSDGSGRGIKKRWKPFSRSAEFQANWSVNDLKVLGSLLISWIIVVHFVERTHVNYTLNKCKWKSWEQKYTDTHRVALVADPQLVDGNSYPDRPDILNYFVKKITDNYLHRNHRFLQHSLDPDTIIFLGDLFDGGREWENELWFQEFRRFNSIFPVEPTRRTIESIPGNHDIGFESIDPEKLRRFSAFFGATNDVIELGNHTIVMLDTISLSSNREEVSQPVQEFLDKLPDITNPNYPRILLTHVPLYRDNMVQVCGPKRESSKPFPVQKGKQYQTVIDSDITRTLLTTINPVLVFGGDDHDYCEISHELNDGIISKEITVKSAAMSAGIQYPAIQLLSLHNPVDPHGMSVLSLPSYDTEMCYMPSPFFGIGLYIIWLVVSIGIVALNCFKPEVIDNMGLYFANELGKDLTIPIFNKAHTKEKISRHGDVTKLMVSSLLVVIIAYSIIGIYYRYI